MLVAYSFPADSFVELYQVVKKTLVSHNIEPHQEYGFDASGAKYQKDEQYPHISIAYDVSSPEEEDRQQIKEALKDKPSFTPIGWSVFPGGRTNFGFLVLEFSMPSQMKSAQDFLVKNFGASGLVDRPHASVVRFPREKLEDVTKLIPEITKATKSIMKPEKPDHLQFWDKVGDSYEVVAVTEKKSFIQKFIDENFDESWVPEVLEEKKKKKRKKKGAQYALAPFYGKGNGTSGATMPPFRAPTNGPTPKLGPSLPGPSGINAPQFGTLAASKGKRGNIVEGKQVGNLYQFIDPDKFVSIVKSNKMVPHGGRLPKGTQLPKELLHYTVDGDMFGGHVFWGVSTTRNANWKPNTREAKIPYWAPIRITLDGDKLSNNYKIIPYNDFWIIGGGKSKNGFDPFYSQSEEVILTDKNGLVDWKKYVVAIDALESVKDQIGDVGMEINFVDSFSKKVESKSFINSFIEENFDSEWGAKLEDFGLEESLNIKEIKWSYPSEKELEDEFHEGEIDNLLLPMGYPKPEERAEAFEFFKNNLKEVEIDPKDLDTENSWRFTFPDYKTFRTQVKGYGGAKDPDSMVRKIQAGGELPMPVVVRMADGSFKLAGGATRTAIANLSGQKIKALAIDETKALERRIAQKKKSIANYISKSKNPDIKELNDKIMKASASLSPEELRHWDYKEGDKDLGFDAHHLSMLWEQIRNYEHKIAGEKK